MQALMQNLPVLMSEKDMAKHLVSLKEMQEDFIAHQRCFQPESTPYEFCEEVLRRLSHLIHFIEKVS